MAAGLVHCNKARADVHIFKMRNGEVELIQSVIGPGVPSSGWTTYPGRLCGAGHDWRD